jgi:alkanesulfonate monooxygenase SsuD/methylene tetrahydromethanopterin reductase-like flavin-dependent oxidoreductase (luciferase family)
MKIGLYMATQWREGAALDHETANLIEQVRVAKANGFASVMVGQHVVSRPLQMFQAIPLLARLAAESGDMLIGPALVLLPLYNPVVVAEEAATIDWFCNGKYVLAGGLGYRQEEFTSMGVPFKERVPRLVESVEIIRKLWRDDEVRFDGRFTKLPGVRASVKPKQAGGPPIWLGGDVEAAVTRAARLGDAWIISPMVPHAEARRLLDVFRATRQQAGLAAAKTYPMIRECHVGSGRGKALDEVREPLLFKYQAYASWGQNETGSVKTDSLAKDFDRFAADRFLIGDEAEVLDGIERYRALGVDHILLRPQWPGWGQKGTIACLERVGQVIGRLKA